MQENEFSGFNLDEKLIAKLNERRITIPTKVQNEVIPKILKEKDVIAQSKTGTGKTLSYVLPLLQINLKKKNPILIIAPTKELARQIYDEVVFFSSNLDFKTILLTGGEEQEKQESKIKDGFDIIIGVTGRIIKLSENGSLKLTMMKKMVLDEADFLIDLGFIKDIEKIAELAKNVNQRMVFSATLSEKTKKVLDVMNNQKDTIRIDAKNVVPENIENYFIPQGDDERDKILINIIKNINPYLCLVFVRTKKESNWLYKILKEEGFIVDCLNGDLAPSQRKKAIENFKNAKTQYLIATDLASRGLDVDGVNYIINYNLPLNELDYLHRAGRTGRMNDKGIVYTICNELDEGYLKKYSANLEFELKPVKITKDGIVSYNNYIGVKARYNIEEMKKNEKIKQYKKTAKEKQEKYADKKKRYPKKR
jgi:ATP-dependent RNA helicase CshB